MLGGSAEESWREEGDEEEEEEGEGSMAGVGGGRWMSDSDAGMKGGEEGEGEWKRVENRGTLVH